MSEISEFEKAVAEWVRRRGELVRILKDLEEKTNKITKETSELGQVLNGYRRLINMASCLNQK